MSWRRPAWTKRNTHELLTLIILGNDVARKITDIDEPGNHDPPKEVGTFDDLEYMYPNAIDNDEQQEFQTEILLMAFKQLGQAASATIASSDIGKLFEFLVHNKGEH